MVTVTDLILEVRQQLDEYDGDAVTDPQIVSALNRAQRNAMNIVAKHFEDFALAYEEVSVTSGDETVAIPETVYAGRVEMIEFMSSASVPYPVKRVSYRQGTALETSGGSARPKGWSQLGQSIKLYPKASAAYTLRLWYTRKIEKLEKPIGRITAISTPTITVDSIGVYDADTHPTGMEAYAAGAVAARMTCWVNVADAQTGAIKGTYEVSVINTVTGALTLDLVTYHRATVLNKTVGTAIASTIAVDDIVSNVRGTGVPELYGEAYQDYLVEYAAYTINRALGQANQDDYVALKELEKEVERIWCGRETTRKITQLSRRWR